MVATVASVSQSQASANGWPIPQGRSIPIGFTASTRNQITVSEGLVNITLSGSGSNYVTQINIDTMNIEAKVTLRDIGVRDASVILINEGETLIVPPVYSSYPRADVHYIRLFHDGPLEAGKINRVQVMLRHQYF
ncbi:MAG: hypothetical protein A3B68_03155 [Candidatus Melainabacteria bacterium RIFCSPHIGHO2_02_FULL_34_12]|nr:MAG: hypothetical protein A3B68_03155 [Candidatus Melainabacteria bacterium RIFCSPHIGHO2_02_FULL_34_12]